METLPNTEEFALQRISLIQALGVIPGGEGKEKALKHALHYKPTKRKNLDQATSQSEVNKALSTNLEMAVPIEAFKTYIEKVFIPLILVFLPLGFLAGTLLEKDRPLAQRNLSSARPDLSTSPSVMNRSIAPATSPVISQKPTEIMSPNPVGLSLVEKLSEISTKTILSADDVTYLALLRQHPEETFEFLNLAAQSLPLKDARLKRELLFFASELDVPLSNRTSALEKELLKKVAEATDPGLQEALVHFPAQAFERILEIDPSLNASALIRKSITAHQGRPEILGPLLRSYSLVNAADAKTLATLFQKK